MMSAGSPFLLNRTSKHEMMGVQKLFVVKRMFSNLLLKAVVLLIVILCIGIL